MGQPLSSAYSMRKRKNAGGSARNRQSEAHKAKAARGSQLAPSDARREKHGLEGKANLYRPQAGEATKSYFMRCPDLGVHNWEQTVGPINIFAAVKMKLARIDRDEAYPVSLGGKRVTVEVRHPNSNKIIQFACEGHFYPKYEVTRQD